MTKPLTIPCLRGSFGDWIYYACLFTLSDVAGRVNYAEEVHDSKELSELIQRQLDGDRAGKIANYLRTNDERFFNSLVLATYQGSPQWFDIGNLRGGKNANILGEMRDGAADALGLLRLDGSERIFALDGQHRLAGIKRALGEDTGLGSDMVPVILVGHATDAAGTRRTRRLFTTLNKTAVAVKKLDIIALDEDDVMAITARRMVERDSSFKSPKVAIISSESMPVTNDTALMTIAGLYDQLKLIFTFEAKRRDRGSTDDDLRFNRPSDDVLDDYYAKALAYFKALGATFPPIAEFLSSRRPREVVNKHRHDDGGHILFRTIGLDTFTRAAVAIATRDGISLAAAVPKLAGLPTELSSVPYRGIIWDPSREIMKPVNKALCRRLVFHLLSLPISARQTRDLVGDYRAALGHSRDDPKIKLPAPLK